MTNYNERLDDLTSFMESIGWEFDENGYTFEDNYINFRTASILRQNINSLIKEPVAELAPISWLIEDLATTIVDLSPEELANSYGKLEALATSILNRIGRSMKDSNELFELCKQVYEAAEWDSEELDHWQERHGGDGMMMLDVMSYEPGVAPLYTSDYLLKKLPSVVQDPYDKIFRHIQMWINGDRSAHAGYVEPYAHDDRVAYAQKSDEMRITLLKLTLKLHEEGLL